MAELKLEYFERAKEFYERVEGFLIEHEACHSLMLGLACQLVEHPELFREGHYLATVEETGEVKAAALMTPPHNPVLSLGFTPGGIRLLAEDLHESYPTLPGVLGPVDVARSFAETWSGLSGQPYHVKRAQRIHLLEKVVPVVGVSGRLRRATKADDPGGCPSSPRRGPKRSERIRRG